MLKEIILVIEENRFFIVVLVAVILGLYYFGGPALSPVRVCFDRQCFLAEVADDFLERQTGLAGRNFLAVNKGMLFVFGQAEGQAMWMKKMKLPLDMVFLDQERRVIRLVENVQPCQESRCSLIKINKPFFYVLEINAGQIRATNLGLGQEMRLEKG